MCKIIEIISKSHKLVSNYHIESTLKKPISQSSVPDVIQFQCSAAEVLINMWEAYHRLIDGIVPDEDEIP